MPAPETDPPSDYCGERTAMMPQRRRTRAQNRAQRIAAERRDNHQARQAQRAQYSNTDQPHPTTTRRPVKDRAGARFGDQQLTDYPCSILCRSAHRPCRATNPRNP